jgi:MFS family permease
MPFLPLYMRQLGVTSDADVVLWTGVTLGVTPAVTALCSPLWGRVGDRFGNKLLVQRSLLGCVIIMAAMGYAGQAWHLFALRALQGLVAGYGPLTISMAALSAPRERMAQAIGTVQTAQRLGPTFGPLIGGILAPLVGIRNAFLVAAFVYGVAFVVLTVLYREPAQGSATAGADRGRVTFGSILALENFLLLMVVIFCLQLVDRSLGPVLALYLGDIGVGADRVPIVAGVLFSMLAFSAAIGHHAAARLLKSATPRAIIAGTSLAGAAALVVFALSTSIWPLILAAAVLGLSVGTSMTTAFTAAGSVIPREVHSTAFGFLTSASLAGVAVSPVLSGLVGARSIRVVFAAGVAVLMALAFVVRRVMVERDLAIERAPAIEES